nr:MAG TPA: hypothetical protein [Caudoviricetes sp.]
MYILFDIKESNLSCIGIVLIPFTVLEFIIFIVFSFRSISLTLIFNNSPILRPV